MIKKYRKKPIIIEAVQFDGTEESFELINKLHWNREVLKLNKLGCKNGN